ncbi:MAG: GspE/PulE family protein [Chloroflexota bacterium]
MADHRNRRLGDILIDSRLITRAQLDEALAVKSQTGERLGEILIGLGYISEANLARALASQLGLELVEPEKLRIDNAAAALISPQVAQRHRAVPFARQGNALLVAMSDPLDMVALDDLALITNCEIKPAVTTNRGLEQALAMAYRAQPVTVSPAASARQSLPRQQLQPDNSEDAPAVRIVDSLIDQALELGASDIHIEPTANEVLVRLRVDGILREALRPPLALHPAIVSRVKIMASLDISERRVPQDGRAFIKDGRRNVDLRVSTLPTIYGEKVAMRVFDRTQTLSRLEDLGFGDEALRRITDLIRRPYGLVLVTGPTGSGKTTTLMAALRRLSSAELNIVTVEDPVEYELAGVNQVQVNDRAGLTFATGLRSILRQDPDIIMVGEVRDGETAEVAVRSALTGHLVLSSVHTNDAASTVGRLRDMGVQPFLLSSSLAGVVAQRLARRLCPACRTLADLPADAPERDALGLGDQPLRAWRTVGCPECGNTGYRGRVAIVEVLTVTAEIRRLIAAGADTSQIRAAARRAGMRSLAADGIEKAAAGITSLAEVRRVTYGDEGPL